MSAGLRAAVRNLWTECRIQCRHRAALRKAKRYAHQNNLRLHLGCGPNIRSGWVNVDLFSNKADLHLDLREPWPFAAASVSVIYSSHFLEHLEYPDEVVRFLKEARRVLAPGGLFSVLVPDTAGALIAYVQGDTESFRIARLKWHPEWCNTWMHQINYHFRQGKEHKYAYDYETLATVLAEAGFVSIAQRRSEPALDCESRQDGSLCVDAHTPMET